MSALRTSTAVQDGSAQPMRGLSARAQALLKPKAFIVFSKAMPAKKSPPLEPKTMNAFERFAARQPDDCSISFPNDPKAPTEAYAKWIKLPARTRPPWPVFRDSEKAKEQGALKPRRNGHGETPLGPLSKRSAKDYAERQAKWKPNQQEVAA